MGELVHRALVLILNLLACQEDSPALVDGPESAGTMTTSSHKPPKPSSLSLPSISQRAAMALCEASLLPAVEEAVHHFAGNLHHGSDVLPPSPFPIPTYHL